MTSITPAEPPPSPPEPGDCCRGDCGDGCVFAIYERDLERWQQAHPEPHPTAH